MTEPQTTCSYCNGLGHGDWPEVGGVCECCKGTGVMNVGYKVEIRQKEPDMKSAVVVWSRYRETMPSAMIAAEQGVVAMHERMGFLDERALGIDIDCARGWNPRTAPITIERGPFTLISKGN